MLIWGKRGFLYTRSLLRGGWTDGDEDEDGEAATGLRKMVIPGWRVRREAAHTEDPNRNENKKYLGFLLVRSYRNKCLQSRLIEPENVNGSFIMTIKAEIRHSKVVKRTGHQG